MFLFAVTVANLRLIRTQECRSKAHKSGLHADISKNKIVSKWLRKQPLNMVLFSLEMADFAKRAKSAKTIGNGGYFNCFVSTFFTCTQSFRTKNNASEGRESNQSDITFCLNLLL